MAKTLAQRAADAYADKLSKDTKRCATNAAANAALAARQALQTVGGTRRLTAAEAAQCYSPAEDAKHQPR